MINKRINVAQNRIGNEVVNLWNKEDSINQLSENVINIEGKEHRYTDYNNHTSTKRVGMLLATEDLYKNEKMLKPHVAKFLDIMLMRILIQDDKYKTIELKLKDYCDYRGIKNTSQGAKEINECISILDRMKTKIIYISRLTKKEEVINVYIGGGTSVYNIGIVKFNFNRDFIDYLYREKKDKKGNIIDKKIQYISVDKEIFQFNDSQLPHAYYLGRKLYLQEKMKKKSKTGQYIISVKVLCDACPRFNKWFEYFNNNKADRYKEYILDVFEKNISANKNVKWSWANGKPKTFGHFLEAEIHFDFLI